MSAARTPAANAARGEHRRRANQRRIYITTARRPIEARDIDWGRCDEASVIATRAVIAALLAEMEADRC